MSDLTKVYKDGHSKATALNKISFDLDQGESMAIVGSSGSGKTTLLHILGGLDAPSSGEVRVNGELLHKMNDNKLSRFRNQTIGFVFQFFYLQEYLSARDNVAMPLIISNYSRKESLKKADELLERFGLGERKNHFPNEISGGEMQRIAIARALINNPKVLLADEPTGNLDKENAEKVLEVFDEIAQSGVSVVVITHDQEISKRFHKTLVLEKGRMK